MSKRIGIFLPNWIGDVVMATPFLRAMHARFGADYELVGIMKPYVSEVLRGTPWLAESLLHDSKKKSSGLTTWQLIHEMRRRQFEKVILLTNSVRTAALARLSGAPQRVGYARDWRSWLLTDVLQPPRHGRTLIPISAVDYYLQLGYHLGCQKESPLVGLPINAEDEAVATAAWKHLGLPNQQRVISFHVAGGWGGKATAKAWPLEHFVDLARRIVSSYDEQILVLCGPNEREAAAEIVRQVGHERVTSLASIEKLPLAITKGCLVRSKLMVTTDSGPRHLATALNVPVVALFGATDPAWTETYHPQAITLFNKLDCGPCKKQHCPLGHHRCMRELSVDRVFAAVQQQLSRQNRAAA